MHRLPCKLQQSLEMESGSLRNLNLALYARVLNFYLALVSSCRFRTLLNVMTHTIVNQCLRSVYCVVVVYHVTIVAIGHGLLEEILAFGTRMRSTHCREFNYLKLCRPAYFVRTTQKLALIFKGLCTSLTLGLQETAQKYGLLLAYFIISISLWPMPWLPNTG